MKSTYFSVPEYKKIIKINVKQAEEYLLSFDNDIDALFILAEGYVDGSFGEVKKGKAIDIYQRLADKGLPDAVLQLAYLYDTDDTREQAVSLYEQAANLGSISAMYCLGQCFVGIDYNKSLYWLTKAIENGDIDAVADICELRIDNEEYEKAYIELAPFAGKNTKIDMMLYTLYFKYGVGEKTVALSIRKKYLSDFFEIIKKPKIILGCVIALILLLIIPAVILFITTMLMEKI